MAETKLDFEKIFKAVPDVPFEQYSEMFKEFFVMKREGGILEVRMHTNDGTPMWNYGLHKGLGQLFTYIGRDLANELLIFTSSGDSWIGLPDMQYMALLTQQAANDPKAYARKTYDQWYMDGTQLLKNFIFNIDIPTITAINGPTLVGHTEWALASDVTLCTPDFEFIEGHYGVGLVPGDGLFLTFKHLLGEKKANMMAYTGMKVNAEKALDWGLVSEVVPRDKLLDRAWEIARTIMKQDYYTRRLTHLTMAQDWKRSIVNDFDFQFACEGWSACMNTPYDANKDPDGKFKK